jgi:hypothetical protein
MEYTRDINNKLKQLENYNNINEKLIKLHEIKMLIAYEREKLDDLEKKINTMVTNTWMSKNQTFMS